MKKVLSLLAITLVLISCSGDDDNKSSNVSVEGTWKMTVFGGETAVDIDMDGDSSNNLITETGCYENETFVFNADGTGMVNSTSYVDIQLDIVAGSTDEYEYTIECVQENDSTTMTWTQNGSSITVISDDASFSGTKDGDKITFVIPNGYDLEVVEGDGTAFLIEDLTIVYEKQ